MKWWKRAGAAVMTMWTMVGCDRSALMPCETACDDMFPVIDAGTDDPNYPSWAVCVAACPHSGALDAGEESEADEEGEGEPE